ncbi:hypothetical protein D3C72_2575670 [compost metagenome]
MGEVRIGQRRQDPAGLVEPTVHRSDEAVDAAGEAVEFGIGKFRLDPPGEIA